MPEKGAREMPASQNLIPVTSRLPMAKARARAKALREDPPGMTPPVILLPPKERELCLDHTLQMRGTRKTPEGLGRWTRWKPTQPDSNHQKGGDRHQPRGHSKWSSRTTPDLTPEASQRVPKGEDHLQTPRILPDSQNNIPGGYPHLTQIPGRLQHPHAMAKM
jgi:hypothetical protein